MKHNNEINDKLTKEIDRYLSLHRFFNLSLKFGNFSNIIVQPYKCSWLVKRTDNAGITVQEEIVDNWEKSIEVFKRFMIDGLSQESDRLTSFLNK